MLVNRLVFFFACIFTLGVAPNLVANVINVNGASDQLDLGKSSYYLIDASGELGIDTIVDLRSNLSWTFADNKSPSFGFNRSNIWYRVELRNTDDHSIEKLLSLTSRAAWSVDVYSQVEGEPIEILAQEVGSKNSYFNRPIDHYFILNRLQMPADKITRVYYRFQSFADSSFYLGLHDEKAFLARDRRFMLLQGAVYGLIFCITLITLLIFVQSRDINFFYYFLLSCSVITGQGIQNSLFHMLFPESGYTISLVWYTNAIVFGFVLTLFTFNFNKTQQFMPKVAAATYALVVVLGILQIFIYTGGYDQITPIVSAGFVVLLLTLLATAFRSYQLGYKPAIFSILGIAGLFVTISAEIFQGLGLFKTQYELTIWVLIGLMVMTTVFSIGLGSYYNYIREETSRLRTEEEVKKVRAKKAELDAVRTNEFMANMSHEIRTPINGILGMSEILSHTDLDDTQAFYNRMVVASGKTLLSVINDILDFSKLRSSKVTIEHISFSMDEIFANSVAAHSPQAKSKAIKLLAFYQPGVPAYFVGDPYRIQQIINNLLSNAIKFTAEGQVDLVISGEAVAADKFVLSIGVRDTGVGVAEDKIKHLFDAFEQADTSITRKFGGTGLGLTIARQLANLMGGDVQVESVLGKGSCFTVTLPLVIDQARESQHRGQLLLLAGKRILVVEGLAIYRDRISKLLNSWNMQVVLVENLSQALEQLDDESFDVVLVEGSWIAEADLADLPGIVNGSVPLVCVQVSPGVTPGRNLILLPESASICELSNGLIRALELNGNPLQDNVSAVGTRTLQQFPDVSLLVAEDNEVNRNVIKVMLEKLGVQVSLVENGQQALECWEQDPKRFSGILMDCEMPIMDGYACTQAIRSKEQALKMASIPIIALTAHVLPEYKARCLDSGMDDILVKPVNLDSLTVMIGKYFVKLGRSRATG